MKTQEEKYLAMRKEIEALSNKAIELRKADADHSKVMACYRKSDKLRKEMDLLWDNWKPVIGEGATLCLYTDRNAHTIISVSKSGKSFKMQRDLPQRLTKPNFIPGGFAGHCTNNQNIEYSYSQDENGSVVDVRWTKKGWSSRGQRVTLGRSEHYDYNF